jgi:hypothetical protein
LRFRRKRYDASALLEDLPPGCSLAALLLLPSHVLLLVVGLGLLQLLTMQLQA